MPSFIPSWDEIQKLLIAIVYMDVVAAVIANIIISSFLDVLKTFRAYSKGRRANRLEVLRRRLDYFQTMK